MSGNGRVGKKPWSWENAGKKTLEGHKIRSSAWGALETKKRGGETSRIVGGGPRRLKSLKPKHKKDSAEQ